MIKTNKKGFTFVPETAMGWVLVIFVAAVLMGGIWIFIIHGSFNTIKTTTQCGTLMGIKGECRITCDPNLEIESPIGGCKGKASKCCVRKEENMNDVILPTPYGGSQDYDFKVTDIAIKIPLPSGCRVTAVDKSYVCDPNTRYIIPIDITVQNVNKGVEVYADPVVVINGNGDNIRKPGTYTGTVKASLNSAGDTKIVSTKIEIAPNDAIPNYYWEIYPYAKCMTQNCRNTDPGTDGILSADQKDFITITFESMNAQ